MALNPNASKPSDEPAQPWPAALGLTDHTVIDVSDPPEDIELLSDEEEEEEEDEDDDDDEVYDDSDVQVVEEVSDGGYQLVDQKIDKKKFHPADDFDYWLSRLPVVSRDYPVKASTHFTWDVDMLSLSKGNKLLSPEFDCGGSKFQILLFDRMHSANCYSLFLTPVQLKGSKPRPADWALCVQFGLMIWNPEHPNVRYFNQSSHRFNGEVPDWGFSNFINCDRVTTKVAPSPTNPHGHGYLTKLHSTRITCFVKVVDDVTGVLWHSLNDYDSRKVTGYTGLKNQGATCYLNSLLQSYFFTRVFRKSVFQIPSESIGSQQNVTHALQRLLYYLLVSDEPVDTSELTTSFGWDAADSFTQHDVQEMNRILMDRLETSMKGTVVEDSLNKTFVGKMKSYIKCVNVDYESSRIEDFWDIQLNVKNLKDVTSSFENYVSTEMLDGENKYDADKFGLQDAEKGVVFEEFPNVLHLQLKRFDYDYEYDTTIKINERYEFPEFMDLKPYLDPSNTKAMAENWEYELFAVLIHSGDFSSGHYYAMIKPDQNTGWFKFDDDKVTRVTKTEVFDDNYGRERLPNLVLQKMTRAEYNDYLIKRHTSAYMLVYFRKSQLDQVLCGFDNVVDVPKHIRDTIETERKEAVRRKKELEELPFYLRIHLFGAGENWYNYQGFDLGINRSGGGAVSGRWNGRIYENPGELALLENHTSQNESDYDMNQETGFLNPPKLLKILRKTTIKEFYHELFTTQMNVEKHEYQYFRVWMLAHRKNETTRPDLPLGYTFDAASKSSTELGPWDITNIHASVTVEQLLEKAANKNFGLFLWVEDIRNDLSSIYKFGQEVLKGPLFPEIPRNFLEFPKIFKQLHLLIDESGKTEEIFVKKPISAKSKEIVLFIKYFDMYNQTLTGLSHISVTKQQKISSIVPIINYVLGFPEDTKLVIYEEIKPTAIEKVKLASDFLSSEIQTGDILTVALAEPVENPAGLIGKFSSLHPFDALQDLDPVEVPVGDSHVTLTKKDVVVNRDKLVSNVLLYSPNIPDFYAYLRSRIHIILRPITRIDGDSSFVSAPDTKALDSKDFTEFQFWVAPQISYVDITASLGKRLGVNPDYIKLFIVPYDSENIPLKKRYSVGAIIGKTFNYNSTITFAYEILNITVDELENKSVVNVGWLPSGVLHENLLEFLVDKTDTVDSLLDKLIHKLGKPLNKNNLLVYSVSGFRVHKYYLPGDGLENLENKSTIYVLEISDEEKKAYNEFLVNGAARTSDTQLIEVIQFSKDPTRLHGIPFHFLLKKDEKFLDTKKRLQNKLSLGVKEFNKILLGITGINTDAALRYCNDDDLILFDEVGPDHVLFLDHPDRSHKSSYGSSRAIFIKN